MTIEEIETLIEEYGACRCIEAKTELIEAIVEYGREQAVAGRKSCEVIKPH